MSLIVQKFGGTSVADSQRIIAAAKKAIQAQQDGHQVVMVVSAMGKNTDLLIDLAHQVNQSPPAREMDMLLSTGEQVSVALMAMAIEALGARAVSLTGAQIGIRTDSSHTKARIHSISTERMERLLSEGYIVIAAGFQGIDEDFNITTLGRGGSDTTAVALAAVLNADKCEIYTDVDGVFTTDPRVLDSARMVQHVSYEEMLELASLGAGVMHSRSIEFAQKFDVPILVRNSMTDQPGSLIWREPESDSAAVFGAAMTKNEARITLGDLPDIPGTNDKIFSAIAKAKVTVDMIVQTMAVDGRVDISFTVPSQDLPATREGLNTVLSEMGGCIRDIDESVSKVSVVGSGMARQIGVAQKMFRALADADIHVQLVTTSEIKISVLVSKDRALDALAKVHTIFNLDQAPESPKSIDLQNRQRDVDVLEVVDRLREAGMEALFVDEILCDDSQASISIENLPNDAAVIAGLFEKVSEGGVFVDMIIENYRDAQSCDVSFTVPREQLHDGTQIAKSYAAGFNATVRRVEAIAKLSVSGIGLRSHTGVAVKMFRALSRSNINLIMLNTSEIRVNVVVDSAQADAALESLNVEFEKATKS